MISKVKTLNVLLTTEKTFIFKILRKLAEMVDKTLVLKSRVNQLEKLCNDHISNMNEYEKEIEALIKTVSELGTISVFYKSRADRADCVPFFYINRMRQADKNQKSGNRTKKESGYSKVWF